MSSSSTLCLNNTVSLWMGWLWQLLLQNTLYHYCLNSRTSSDTPSSSSLGPSTTSLCRCHRRRRRQCRYHNNNYFLHCWNKVAVLAAVMMMMMLLRMDQQQQRWMVTAWRSSSSHSTGMLRQQTQLQRNMSGGKKQLFLFNPCQQRHQKQSLTTTTTTTASVSSSFDRRHYHVPLSFQSQAGRRQLSTLHADAEQHGGGSDTDKGTGTSTSTIMETATTTPTNGDGMTATSSPKRIKTKDAIVPTTESILIQGWVRTIRKQKTLVFVEVNDGSNLSGIQCVINLDNNIADGDTTTTATIDQITTGAAVEFIGPLVASQGSKQAVEVQVQSFRVVGTCPPDSYPLAKKRHSLEYLRSIAHLRPRTNTLSAVARVRSILAGSIHAFFQQENFIYVQTPLITASDCEGAGELFRVTTLPTDQPSKIPVTKDGKSGTRLDQTDYSQDFFGKPAFLTVSGQLSAETHACALGDVYTFGPTFRAENSQTSRHLAEFHMVEPEMAFATLETAMDNAEAMLKYTVQQVLDKCPEDLAFFTSFYDKQLLERLQTLVEKPFVRISYREAIVYLQEEIAKDPSKWQFPDVAFGTDLATEHERWLAETKFASAVFVYNYPKSIKAFYMRDNDDDNGETVNAMDLLVPGVGELIGGSQREERLDVLIQKMQDVDLNPNDYWWYLDLRRYGSVPHAGYGLGFERLVTYVCGMDNIREAIAFPRYPGSAEF